MTITATALTGGATVWGNKRVRTFDLVFSGNYATGGETVTATSLGFRKIEAVIGGTIATSTDLATANPVAYRVASTGLSVVVLQYEGSAAGTAISEKTGAEVYATGSNARVTVVGTG